MAQVFVVDRTALFGGAWPHGFQAIGADATPSFLEHALARGRFVDRQEAEDTPDWKQWIPYCVLRCRPATPTGEADPNSLPTGVFRVQRTTKQSEARLHGSWSIGLGGHVEPEDTLRTGQATGPDFFAGALARELREELDVGHRVPHPRFLGLVNDDRTAVGRVHAGLVYVWDLIGTLAEARESVKVREISKMRGGFGSLVEFEELWQDPRRFESWSQFLVRSGVLGPMGGLRSAGHPAGTPSP